LFTNRSKVITVVALLAAACTPDEQPLIQSTAQGLSRQAWVDEGAPMPGVRVWSCMTCGSVSHLGPRVGCLQLSDGSALYYGSQGAFLATVDKRSCDAMPSLD